MKWERSEPSCFNFLKTTCFICKILEQLVLQKWQDSSRALQLRTFLQVQALEAPCESSGFLFCLFFFLHISEHGKRMQNHIFLPGGPLKWRQVSPAGCCVPSASLFQVTLEVALSLPGVSFVQSNCSSFLSCPWEEPNFWFYVCLSLINFNKSFLYNFLEDGFFWVLTSQWPPRISCWPWREGFLCRLRWMETFVCKASLGWDMFYLKATFFLKWGKEEKRVQNKQTNK